MLNNAVEQRAEGSSVAEAPLVDLVEDLSELGLKLVVVVEMPVAQIVDILREVAKEENVLLADFARNFDLQNVRLAS